MLWIRRLAAVAVAVALLGVPGAVCCCRAEAMASTSADHDCCAPKTGVRTADPACCRVSDSAPATSLAPPDDAPALLGPLAASVLLEVPVVRHRPATPFGGLLAAAPPPPTVLRI